MSNDRRPEPSPFAASGALESSPAREADERMRVTVMGSGGTGGYFGGLLARSGEDVTFIARGAHLAAIRKSGLTVRSRLVGRLHRAGPGDRRPGRVRAGGPRALLREGLRHRERGRAPPARRGPDTVILPVQNGIDSAERIGRIVGPRRVIGGLAGVSSVVAAPGVIEHRAGPDVIQLGELDGPPSPRTERVVEALARAGIKAQVRPDMRVALWEKFVLICGLSGLTALTRLPLGAVLACPRRGRSSVRSWKKPRRSARRRACRFRAITPRK